MKKMQIKKGDHLTFLVEVKSTKNHTWQGVLTWVEEQKKESFRSTLELLRLLDSTIETKE